MLHNVADSDYDKFMIGKLSYTSEELRMKVPKENHNEIEVFMKKEADTLPPHRPVDHGILLEEGKTPSFTNPCLPKNLMLSRNISVSI
jgi:hypothetical protein